VPDTGWVLVAEDSDDDFAIIQHAFHATNPRLDIRRGADGQEALDILATAYSQPFLVLLDVKMPRLSGFETLVRLRESPATRYLPVVMLTDSDDPPDVAQAYRLGCSAYLLKPPDLEKFQTALRTVLALWAGFVTPPDPHY
jgi:two-component system response regulator